VFQCGSDSVLTISFFRRFENHSSRLSNPRITFLLQFDFGSVSGYAGLMQLRKNTYTTDHYP